MRYLSRYHWVRMTHTMSLRSKHFMERPWAGGLVLLVCVAVAMLLANLPATREIYHHLLHTDLSLWIRSKDGVVDWLFPREMTVEKFINDGVMVIFFFSVGLEIKREVVNGQLSTLRKAIFPVIAAAGGMLAPALIYIGINAGTPAMAGWAIPTATDIAFAVAILSMLSNRVPVSLKIFLTALAIADDLGAILVIALFYGSQLNLTCLLVALLIMAGVYLMNRMGEKRMAFYLVPAIVVWVLFYYSGVHSTLSGVAMALLIPSEPRYSEQHLTQRMRALKERLLEASRESDDPFPNEEQRYCLLQMQHLAAGSVGMSDRLEHALSPYVTFLVMPIFALANAGVEIPSLAYFNIAHTSPAWGSVGLGVFLGLVLGKPLGIWLASWLAVKFRVATMPDKASWSMLFAVACLGGIGFTMSIFVDSLAFTDMEMLNRGKIAILMGSVSAALLGSLLILLFSKKQAR